MEFIDKYSRVDAISAVGDEVNYSDIEFIDDKTNVQDQGLSDYCITNITRDLHDAMPDDSMAEVLDLVCSDSILFVSDYVEEIEYEFDKFEGFKSRTKKLNKT